MRLLGRLLLEGASLLASLYVRRSESALYDGKRARLYPVCSYHFGAEWPTSNCQVLCVLPFS